MKADPDAQLKLLDVQALDSRADQLRHQRANLPEIAEIATLTASRAELNDSMRDMQIAVDDLTAAQKKADRTSSRSRSAGPSDQDRMDQGLISNPKDLERMQHELDSLNRRITTLEDEELEVMEELEEAQVRLTELQRQIADADERLSALTAERDRRTAEIDAELSTVSADREPRGRGHARRPARALRPAPREQERRGRRRAAGPPVRRLPARPRPLGALADQVLARLTR